MAVILAALSFTCAALLAVFIPVGRIRTSIPDLAIVLWLTGYNIIHGVNAVVWAGNVDIHIPVWCDIVTKFMLGANIALPGALVCISLQLELVSSSKTILSDPRVVRNRTILEFLLCYVVPMIYMSLHVIAQDHRFDLVRDFGCSASTHPSTVGFLLLWIPPLLVCSIAFVFSGMSVHNSGQSRLSTFRTYLESRCSMTSSLFYRRLTTCMILAGSLTLISLSSLFSVHNFQPWISWDFVHASMATVEIVQFEDDVRNVQFAWWSTFAVSVIYIVLSFAIGEEARDSYRRLHDQFTRKRQLPKLVLPSYHLRKSPAPETAPRSASLTSSKLRPLTIELKSGWDDFLDEKKTKRKGSPRHSKNLTASACSSPTPSHRSTTEEDQAFMASTISYLGSPTARTLAAAFSPPPRNGFEIPPKPSSPPPPVPTSKPKSILKAPPKSVPVDVEPTINSVLDANWPVPPESPTPSRSHSRHGSGRSRSHSPASSAEEAIGYPLRPTVTPPHLRTRPFEGSNVPPNANVSPRKPILKRPSIRSLHKSWSRERLGQGHPGSDVIYMTVVKETA
ncbi:hypothetical protein M413DRAFT_445226 [Hebeloma cylindrosporum]|uniref:STE3-domain-containing protein n=1 Tax=Hebeloma cylindrosporum TaxID=76867 RepID=A0A0C3CCT4_HEBCY|nr:hypothetical protein M413DRAFT_445226 [Hebeloma cylindrosporum h7]